MQGETLRFSLPRWRATRWLTDAGSEVPTDIRVALIGGLFGTLPIFGAGVVNTIAVSVLIALRIPTWPFILWCAFDILCCLARTAVLMIARRRAARQQETPTDLYILLGVAWAAGVGFGAFISLLSGDWVVATLACLSATAMVGGTCFRNFGAPRMAGLMIILTLGPCTLATPFMNEPIMLIGLIQLPFYIYSMLRASFGLNAMLVSTMQAERAHAFQARHDVLTGLSNRVGLTRALNASLARQDGAVALIYLDLDGFKAVNDTHGHVAGDRLLQLVSERLRRLVRSGDLVARIGGDEFIVLSEQPGSGPLKRLGERLIREISLPYVLDEGVTVTIGASIGIARAPDHGLDMESLMSAADAALYQAKSGGKSRCVIAALPKPTPVTPLDTCAQTA
ncbi:GGDEF domain-containing protein [Bosea sp. (in: a-proteobacteria)]|uniref:GGDEF domain-containing protein n=1 Tax=Bosea sp. (in: a-proteobacteria) TaxID=1871050 RepID=UPI002734C232|nr:GGDEF domain-containing protein [Bosea sp. (in: a-proteobacteria)]MDP3409446.1 GGDEF domain-containing protein [Bosea sp. (in: a-proteobacteria)]